MKENISKRDFEALEFRIKEIEAKFNNKLLETIERHSTLLGYKYELPEIEVEVPKTKTVAWLEYRRTCRRMGGIGWIRLCHKPFDSTANTGQAIYAYLTLLGNAIPPSWQKQMLKTYDDATVIGLGTAQYRLQYEDVSIDIPVAEVMDW